MCESSLLFTSKTHVAVSCSLSCIGCEWGNSLYCPKNNGSDKEAKMERVIVDYSCSKCGASFDANMEGKKCFQCDEGTVKKFEVGTETPENMPPVSMREFFSEKAGSAW